MANLARKTFGNIYKISKRLFSVDHRWKYDCSLEQLINEQIKYEQQAGQEYLAMAVYFAHATVSRLGCYSFYMKMYHEELDHMKMMIDYQLLRGGRVRIQGLVPPSVPEDLTVLLSFQRSLGFEKFVTQKIEDIIACAEENKDYQCADWVTEVFLGEQMKSIYEISLYIAKLKNLNGDEHGLYHFDQILLEKFPIKKQVEN